MDNFSGIGHALKAAKTVSINRCLQSLVSNNVNASAGKRSGEYRCRNSADGKACGDGHRSSRLCFYAGTMHLEHLGEWMKLVFHCV